MCNHTSLIYQLLHIDLFTVLLFNFIETHEYTEARLIHNADEQITDQNKMKKLKQCHKSKQNYEKKKKNKI